MRLENNTLPLFSPFTGSQLRDAGIKVAVEHADLVEPSWSEQAFDALKQYIRNRHGSFMAEDVRSYARAIGVPNSPSARAWGGVIQRAAREKLIKHIGFASTSNPKSHKTPASLWESV